MQTRLEHETRVEDMEIGEMFGLDAFPRRYNFILNPYPDQRLSRCPMCDGKTGQRKRPLLIHIDPRHLIALNYTCRYCPACDLLIAHKHEIEHLLYCMFSENAPSAIGNEYLMLGTVERAAWREGVTQPKTPREMLSHTSLFKTYYEELRMTASGWYADEEEPPIMEPPPSQEWVKPKAHRRRRRPSRR
jgi:hypothetical protein